MRVPRLVLAVAVLLGLIASAGRSHAQGAQSHDQGGQSLEQQSQAWRSTAEPEWRRMSLGLRAERWQPEQWLAGGPRPRARRKVDDCRKWRSVADRLGETYAGWTLRNSVLRRVCSLVDGGRADDAWDFPWGALQRGRVVPPRHVRTIGAWDVRCGSAGSRRRCALVAELGPVMRGTEGDAPRPVAHFVIDMVGGREALLWRLFIPAERGTAVTRLDQREEGRTTSDAAPATPVASLPEGRQGKVRYRLGDREHEEAVPACAAAGCLMEANVLRAGTVATRLWDGHGVDLAFLSPAARRVELQLPAAGFRVAFAELVRLRREERRGR